MRLQSFLREPLLHFLVIGAALFAYFQWSTSGSSATNRIVLTAGQIEQLAAGFTKTWKRPPTDPELKGIIDDWVREELSVQAAMAAGLDRGDPVIRRRLRSKFEFFVEDMGELAAPEEALLQAWFVANQAKYRTDAKLGFQQIYFSKERRGASAADDAALTLKRLAAEGLGGTAADLGDPSLLPRDLSLVTAREIDEMFGSGFAAQLNGLDLGGWAGPIDSAYGSHLILLRERLEGTVPDFTSVRAAVERDYLTERRRQQLDLAYQALVKKYIVVVEAPGNRVSDPARAGR
jgi:PPIC-type PPIASE domain